MIVRILKFVVWTVAVLFVLMFILFMTQMGDCPEKVIDASVGNACTMQKHLWGWGSILVAVVAWITGTYRIFKHRDAD